MRPTWRRVAVLAAACAAGIACGDGGSRTADSAVADVVSRAGADAPAAPDGWTVSEAGIGPIRAGMTVGEASAVVAGALVAPAGVEPGGCAYLEWRGGIPGVAIMVEGGRVARVDVDSGAVATDAGVRVGDGEERVRSAYAGRVSELPHKYEPGGRYLVIAPEPATDSTLRLVFETDGARITRYRAGRMPQVMYVERCG